MKANKPETNLSAVEKLYKLFCDLCLHNCGYLSICYILYSNIAKCIKQTCSQWITISLDMSVAPSSVCPWIPSFFLLPVFPCSHENFVLNSILPPHPCLPSSFPSFLPLSVSSFLTLSFLHPHVPPLPFPHLFFLYLPIHSSVLPSSLLSPPSPFNHSCPLSLPSF